MPKRWVLIAALYAITGFAAPLAASAERVERALEIARVAERVAGSRVFWPGFEPMTMPLAVYDGKRTYLFRHPSPPEGFAPVAGSQPAAHVYEGRHPAVTSNTSADIGGTVTATLLADGPRLEGAATELAAVALHEAFHVFQRRRHPGWQGNEGDLFLYPFDDARLLARRRLETEALRRALAEPDSAQAACWTRQALAFRRERFAGMDPAFPAYERGTELNEGIAMYVQVLAAGRTTVEIPAGEFGATEVRHRVYTIGPALALLLDRFRPAWKASLEADDRQHLDEMLAAAVAGGDPPSGQCAFTAGETAEVERVAQRDAAAVRTKRVERRKAFDARPGWRVVVQAADGQPLWPQGFDPLNVESVEGGLLHTRYVRLGNDSGQLQMVDEEGADLEALSEGIGAHPLFQGVRRVAIAVAKPEIRTKDGTVSLQAPGFTARFENARAEVRETAVFLHLGGMDANSTGADRSLLKKTPETP